MTPSNGAGHNRPMRLFTIGFTKSSAEDFFTRLKNARVSRVVDVRLHNVSQLSGFAKRDDLRYFLKAIAGVDYEHRLELAPTSGLLDAYKKGRCGWTVYARDFLRLIAKREIERIIPRDTVDGACLLCSEDEPHHCHRRLVAEYLRDKWGDVEVAHL